MKCFIRTLSFIALSLSCFVNNSHSQETHKPNSTAIKRHLAKLHAFKKLSQFSYDQLQKIETTLRNKQAAALENIRITFNIPENEWKKTLETIEKIKIFNKTHSFKKPIAGVVHDKTLPNYILTTTKEILKNYGINPECVSLYNGLAPNTNNAHINSDTILAQAINPNIAITHHMINNKTVNITMKTIKPAAIYFNLPALQKLSQEKIRAVIAHEVTHLIENHCTEQAHIIQLLKKHGYNENLIKKHSAILTYLQSTETNADLLPAVQNKNIAWSMKSFYVSMCRNNPFTQNKHRGNGTHPSPYSQYVHLCVICKAHGI